MIVASGSLSWDDGHAAWDRYCGCARICTAIWRSLISVTATARLVSDSPIVPLIAHRPGKLERRAVRMRAKGEQLVFDFLPREK